MIFRFFFFFFKKRTTKINYIKENHKIIVTFGYIDISIIQS